MKVRTSISVADNLLRLIDKLPHKPARSEIIEEALKLYFKNLAARARDNRDRELLDSGHERFNDEAADILSYQKKK